MDYDGIGFEEGPWPQKAYWDALYRARERDSGLYVDYGWTRPKVISRGPIAQRVPVGGPQEGGADRSRGAAAGTSDAWRADARRAHAGSAACRRDRNQPAAAANPRRAAGNPRRTAPGNAASDRDAIHFAAFSRARVCRPGPVRNQVTTLRASLQQAAARHAGQLERIARLGHQSPPQQPPGWHRDRGLDGTLEAPLD